MKSNRILGILNKMSGQKISHRFFTRTKALNKRSTLSHFVVTSGCHIAINLCSQAITQDEQLLSYKIRYEYHV